MSKEWAVGVTTVPERYGTCLDRTLRSLGQAGFPAPRLFVDGADQHAVEYSRKYPDNPLTTRWPLVRVALNWTLGLWELYARQPRADLYAVFQDDVLLCRDVREYVERSKLWEQRVYLNLWTGDSPPARGNVRLSQEHPRDGWFKSNQLGCGAVALVFSNEGVRDLLGSRLLVGRPYDDAGRGWRGIDGGVSEALCRSAQLREGRPYTEYCHKPSLVQHVGEVSTVDKREHVTAHKPDFPRRRYAPEEGAPDFPGEHYSPLHLLDGDQ